MPDLISSRVHWLYDKAESKGTRSNSRKVKDKDKDLIQDTSVSYPYLCDICKGNDTLRSVLHNDEVKTFISKISDLTQANDKLSDQISILKNMDLHIQHILLIDPKQLVHNNVKLTKLDLQFQEFKKKMYEKTEQLTNLLSDIAEKPVIPQISPTLLEKLDNITSV